jgi:hypothetical protein
MAGARTKAGTAPAPSASRNLSRLSGSMIVCSRRIGHRPAQAAYVMKAALLAIASKRNGTIDFAQNVPTTRLAANSRCHQLRS